MRYIIGGLVAAGIVFYVGDHNILGRWFFICAAAVGVVELAIEMFRGFAGHYN